MMSKETRQEARGKNYVLKGQNEWNPLLKYPRNDECFCHSGEKAKKCCLPDVAEVVTTKQAKEIVAALKNGQAIILTDEKTEDHVQASVQIGSSDEVESVSETDSV